MPEVSLPKPFKPRAHWKATIAPLIRGKKYKLSATQAVPKPTAIIQGWGLNCTKTTCNSGAKIWPTIRIVR